MKKLLLHPAAKPAVFAICLLPFAWLVYGVIADRLGPNPAEALIRASGDWALRGLWIALAVTPLRMLTGMPALARFRRMIGLFAFFYALVHLLCYAWLDMGFDVPEIVRDIAKRPFILVGMLAFALLLVLAATSFNRAIRWLGGKRWQWLHRLIYLIAPLGILHFWWMKAGKNDFQEPIIFGVIVAALLGLRVYWSAAKKTQKAAVT